MKGIKLMGFIDWSEWVEEPLIIQVHVVIAITGLLVGGYAMLARKGTKRHKFNGRIFAMLALLTALTSFFIHEIQMWGIWSPIHLLSLFTIWMVWRGVVMIRRGNVKSHQRHMRFIYLSGFIVAGAFTLMPGRMPNEIFLERGFEYLSGSEAMAERIALIFPVAAIVFSLWALIRTYGQNLIRRGPQQDPK
jgi:uncharacterized membrane protein